MTEEIAVLRSAIMATGRKEIIYGDLSIGKRVVEGNTMWMRYAGAAPIGTIDIKIAVTNEDRYIFTVNDYDIRGPDCEEVNYPAWDMEQLAMMSRIITNNNADIGRGIPSEEWRGMIYRVDRIHEGIPVPGDGIRYYLWCDRKVLAGVSYVWNRLPRGEGGNTNGERAIRIAKTAMARVDRKAGDGEFSKIAGITIDYGPTNNGYHRMMGECRTTDTGEYRLRWRVLFNKYAAGKPLRYGRLETAVIEVDTRNGEVIGGATSE
jgi:hypothetical protein